MTIQSMVNACNGCYHGPKQLIDKEITGVATDSRKVLTDFLFVPLKGEKVDGHDFIGKVMAAGALVTLSEVELEDDFPYIKVQSCLQALKDLAKYYRNQLSCTIVGITGSVGKTSTKEMIASVLEQRYRVQKTAGNFNNEIGLPLTIFSITQEHEVAVVEMGISDFGEMSRLAEITKPDICVITNIGYSHLEQLVDRDGVLKAKTEVLPFIQPGGSLILNGDDDKLLTIKSLDQQQILYYSMENNQANYFAPVEKIKGTLDPIITFYSKMPGKEETNYPVVIPVPGSHQVMNAMAAACVGELLGLTIEEIKEGILQVPNIQGRSNFLRKHHMLIIDDCYNANPMSMKASIEVLSQIPGRTIAVLGDMGELGGETRKLHGEVGEVAAKCQIHTLVLIGELAKEIGTTAKQNKNSVNEIYYFSTKEKALPFIKGYVKAGDSILIKASHFMKFEQIVESLTKDDLLV